MKSIIIICSFFISSALFAESEEIFSKPQNQKIVEAIDNICADSWCEGNYNYEFTSFSCDKSVHTCNLSFYFINTETEDGISVYSPLQICSFSNIMNLKQILTRTNSLNDNFYSELDMCISALEENAPF